VSQTRFEDGKDTGTGVCSSHSLQQAFPRTDQPIAGALWIYMNFLYFLAEGWFVVPWYVIGALGAWFVIYDVRNENTPLKPAMKWGWPIIVFFFSVIGLFLYFSTARAPGIGDIQGDVAKKEAHDRFEDNVWRRVNGAVIHCVAGDGFGIMTGMVIARSASMSFWQEFWFEYIVGFVVGWVAFQRKSMEMMTDNLANQLAMAFRGEFFSMLTVMGGMGAVMTFVTPLVATSQPKPLTYAFWGFGMLGLLAGYVLTYPMNWMMLKVGWKHGMGGMKGAERKQVESTSARVGLIAAMSVLGAVALLFVAWLTDLRAGFPIRHERPAITTSQAGPGQALHAGLRWSFAVHSRVCNKEIIRRRPSRWTMRSGPRRSEPIRRLAPSIVRWSRFAPLESRISRAVNQMHSTT
jgi:hypothetical protein